jgi:hypothetical protein
MKNRNASREESSKVLLDFLQKVDSKSNGDLADFFKTKAESRNLYSGNNQQSLEYSRKAYNFRLNS